MVRESYSPGSDIHILSSDHTKAAVRLWKGAETMLAHKGLAWRDELCCPECVSYHPGAIRNGESQPPDGQNQNLHFNKNLSEKQ